MDLPVFGAPALDKTDSDSAHVGKRVDRLEAIVDALFQQCRKVLIIEDFQIATYKCIRAIKCRECLAIKMDFTRPQITLT